MITVIAKNNLESSIDIDDLGLTLTPTEIRTLSDTFSYTDISDSSNLRSYVSAGSITINDGISDLNIDNALLHLMVESEYQDLLQDEGMGTGSECQDLLCIQNRRTTSFDLTTTWQNVQMEINDVNSDPTKMVFIPPGTLQVVEEGYYKFVYTFQVESQGTTVHTYARFILNGSTPIPGSETTIKTYQNEVHELHVVCIAHLNANDQINMQVRCEATPVVCHGTIGLCVKLNGVKGDTGAPGGTTITTQHENLDVTLNTNIINFEGAVTVVDEGTGKATVNIGTGVHENKYFQAYDSIGNVDINTATPTPIPWNVEQVKDVDTFNHSTVVDNTRVTVLQTGLYCIIYIITGQNTSNSRRNPRAHVRLNGVTDLIPSVSYAYVRLNGERGTNTACFMVNLTAGDYVEVLTQLNVDTGNIYSVPNESWMNMKYIRGL